MLIYVTEMIPALLIGLSVLLVANQKRRYARGMSSGTVAREEEEVKAGNEPSPASSKAHFSLVLNDEEPAGLRESLVQKRKSSRLDIDHSGLQQMSEVEGTSQDA